MYGFFLVLFFCHTTFRSFLPYSNTLAHYLIMELYITIRDYLSIFEINVLLPQVESSEDFTGNFSPLEREDTQ